MKTINELLAETEKKVKNIDPAEMIHEDIIDLQNWLLAKIKHLKATLIINKNDRILKNKRQKNK